MTITSLVCLKLIINPFNNISNKKTQHQTQVLVENKISCQILVNIGAKIKEPKGFR